MTASPLDNSRGVYVDKLTAQALRNLPKIDEMAAQDIFSNSELTLPEELIVKVCREVVDEERNKLLEQEDYEPLSSEDLLKQAYSQALSLARPNLRTCVNAAGVVIHTNMGRSVLSEDAAKAVYEVARSYSNLELNVKSGLRGNRHNHIEGIIKELTGAEAALVVNNNAAAVMLVLNELAKGKEAIISRGELIEIGGSFRIPAIMDMSNAHMVEVGTTNKTHLYDYQNTISEETSIFLKVHPSNYRIVGFQESVDPVELCNLAHEHGIYVYEDQGSGVLVNLEDYGLPHERTVEEAIAEGIDLVSFSGDKLLGSAQAGIIVGKKELIERLKKNQMLRALRPDKLTLTALEHTLLTYRDTKKALRDIPTLRMLTKSYDETHIESENFISRLKSKLSQDALKDVELESLKEVSRAGGGALPAIDIATSLVLVHSKRWTATQMKDCMRLQFEEPIICRIIDDALALDLRTVLSPEQTEYILDCLVTVLETEPK